MFHLSVHPGITTTGSTLREYQYYVSAYRLLYSNDGQRWHNYKEANSTLDMVTHTKSINPCMLNSYVIGFHLVQIDKDAPVEGCRDTYSDCCHSNRY